MHQQVNWIEANTFELFLFYISKTFFKSLWKIWIFLQEFAEKQFQNIAEAYEVLSDDEMRKIYDEGGSLAEACCKRKYQQSNEVGEDDENEGNFFRYENIFLIFQ